MQVIQLLFCLGSYSVISFSLANGKLLIEGTPSDRMHPSWEFFVQRRKR